MGIEKRFAKNFIAIRTAWAPIEFLTLMLAEKSVELLTNDISKIILVKVTFVGMYLLFHLWFKSFTRNMSNQLALRNIMFTVIVLPLIVLAGQAYIPYWGYYILTAIMVLASQLFIPSVSYLMFKGVKFNNRPWVIKRIDFASSIVGMLSYLIVGLLVHDLREVVLLNSVIIVLSAATYFFTHKGIKMWLSHDTRDHLILSQQQANAAASNMYRKHHFKLKDSLGMVGVLTIFAIYQILYGSIDSMNTAYVHDVLKKGQEVQFLLVATFLVGAASIALYKTYTVSRIRASYLLQNSLLFVALYMFVLYQQASIVYLYILMFLLGAMSGLVLLATSLSVHQNTRPEELHKRLNLYNMILHVGPVLSSASIWYLYQYTQIKTTEVAMWVAFACMGLMSFIILIRFFKPKTRDMTYSKYR